MRRPAGPVRRDPARAADLEAAVDELADLVEGHLGATIFAREIITRDNREMVIDA